MQQLVRNKLLRPLSNFPLFWRGGGEALLAFVLVIVKVTTVDTASIQYYYGELALMLSSREPLKSFHSIRNIKIHNRVPHLNQSNK